MRKTGSRDPRESLEASAVSPFSIAVNTFSMRFGSRRNQRPPHQKIRSITTVRPMIDTIKIGHMMGPPLWNLSINQLLARKPVGCASGLGEAAGEAVAAAGAAAGAAGLAATPGAGLSVTGTDAPGAAGWPGCAGAAGFTAAGAPGLAAAGAPGGFATGGAPGGDVCGGAGDCASEISANASETRQAVS